VASTLKNELFREKRLLGEFDPLERRDPARAEAGPSDGGGVIAKDEIPQ
jgi:hypothetical protein